MDWDITMEHDGVALGKFGSHRSYQDDLEIFVTGFLPRRINKDHPVGETAIRVNTFIS